MSTGIAKLILDTPTNPQTIYTTQKFTRANGIILQADGLPAGQILEIAAELKIAIKRDNFLGFITFNSETNYDLGVRTYPLEDQIIDNYAIIRLPYELTTLEYEMEVCLYVALTLNIKVYAIEAECDLVKICNVTNNTNAQVTALLVRQIAGDAILLAAIAAIGATVGAAIPAIPALPAGVGIPALPAAGIPAIPALPPGLGIPTIIDVFFEVIP